MNLSILRNLVIASALLLSACSNKDDSSVSNTVAPSAKSTPTGLLYVGHDTGPVSLYALAEFNKLGEIAVGDMPASQGGQSLALSEDGTLLAVAMAQGRALAIVNTSTQQTVHQVQLGSEPKLVQVHGMTAVVAHAPKQISVIDLPAGETKRTFNVAIEPQHMAIAANGQHLVATNEDFDELFVYDLNTGELAQQTDVSEHGVRPRGVVQSPDGKHLALAMEYSNKVLILNDEYKVVSEVLTGEVPYAVAYNQDGSELVVALVRGKAIQVFDSNTLMLKRELPVGEQCMRFVFSPEDTHLIVACGLANKLLMLNYTTGELVREIEQTSTSRGLAARLQ